jgi:hypothetical protein
MSGRQKKYWGKSVNEQPRLRIRVNEAILCSSSRLIRELNQKIIPTTAIAIDRGIGR